MGHDRASLDEAELAGAGDDVYVGVRVDPRDPSESASSVTVEAEPLNVEFEDGISLHVDLRLYPDHLRLPKELHEAVLINTRSKVVFQTGARDAAELAKHLHNLAFSLKEQGLVDEAHATMLRSLVLSERYWGPEALNLAHGYNLLGAIESSRRRTEEALALARRAAAGGTTRKPPDAKSKPVNLESTLS